MKISIVTFGTQGDIHPSLALAIGLKRRGHEVTLCTSPDYEEFVKSYDCSFKSFGDNFKEYVMQQKKTSNKLKVVINLFKFVRRDMIKQIDCLTEVLKGFDLIIGTSFIISASTVADYLNISYQSVTFFPTMLGRNNNFAWRLQMKSIDFIFKRLLNKKRAEIKLKPVKNVSLKILGNVPIVASDIPLMSVPENVKFKYIQTGYMYLKNKAEKLNDEIENFLQSGPTPIFIGFGSMSMDNPTALKASKLFVQVAESLKLRFIIQKAWSGLKDLSDHKNCIFVDDVSYELLFPRVAIAIHHGGAGTVQMAARAGVPQMIIPFMNDQFNWRVQIVKLGLGPYTRVMQTLTAKSLSKSISECLTNEKYRKKAKEIAETVKKIDGIELTVNAIEERLFKTDTIATHKVMASI
jgi:UDP:flavonoid glycosyltransferase YjiC (YdhE family)